MDHEIPNLLRLLRGLEPNSLVFLEELIPRYGFQSALEAIVGDGCNRFDLLRVLVRMAAADDLEPRACGEALGRVGIHPLSLALAGEASMDRSALAERIGCVIPPPWAEALGLPFLADPDAPDPVNLVVCGNLEIRKVPNLCRLPLGLGVEEELLLHDLPDLEELPEDVWFTRVEVERCPCFRGSPRLACLTLEGAERLSAHYGVKAPYPTLAVIDCANLTILPDLLEVDCQLRVVRCPALTRLPKILNTSILELRETLPGLQRLSGRRESFITLSELPDLEVVEDFAPRNSDEWCAVTLQTLPKLRSIQGMKALLSLGIEDCPQLRSLPVGGVKNDLVLSDLPALERLEGCFHGQQLSLTRCWNLTRLPELGEAMTGLVLRACPMIQDIPRMDATRIEVFGSGFQPQSSVPVLDDWRKAAHAERALRSELEGAGSSEPRWAAALEAAPTVFSQIRFLRDAFLAGCSIRWVEAQRVRWQIPPISLLLALHTPGQVARLGGALGLPPEMVEACTPQAEGLDVDDMIRMTKALLLYAPFPVPRSVEICRIFIQEWPVLEVEGTLRLQDVGGIRHLPPFLRVGGSMSLIDLVCLEDDALPEGWVVEGRTRFGWGECTLPPGL